MVQDFKTEEEARAALAEQLNNTPDWFCPLIKDICRKGCVCLVKAAISDYRSWSNGVGVWHVNGFYCDNAMFVHHDNGD